MKFKNTPIIILILFSILNICSSQLFEQFNDEPVNLEKKARSLFDDQEEIKPITKTPTGNKNTPSIFNTVEDEGLKPIELKKPHTELNHTPINKPIVPLNPIRNLVKNTLNVAVKTNNPAPQSKMITPISAQKKEAKDEIKIREEKLKEIKNKNNEKLRLQREEIKNLQVKFDQINQKTKNIMKVMKKNSSLEKLKQKYKENVEMIEGYSKDFKYMDKNINKLEKNIDGLSSELEAIENKKDLKGINEVKKIVVSQKLKIGENLNTKKLLTEELKFGDNKISNNFIQLDGNFKIVYKNQVIPFNNLLSFNHAMKTLKNNCGNNLDCFVTKSFLEEKQQKDSLIEQTLENIKNHLNNLRS